MPLLENLREVSERIRARRSYEAQRKSAQKLILPCRRDNAITAAWKNPLYKQYWRWTHYGMDIQTSDPGKEVLALGDGRVAAAGVDSLFGGTVAVVYPNVLLEREKRVMDVTCRCYHLSKVLAKPGQAVRAGDVIGVQGNTGAYQAKMGVHLHIEFDRDTAHPCHVPGIAKDGNIIKRGTDSTLDPADVFHRGPGQTARSVSYAGWTTEKDWTYSEG